MRIGVVFGSRSVEHEVSVITACQLMKNVDSQHEVVALYIDKQGRWWTGDSLRLIETYQNLDLNDPHTEDIEPIEFSPDPTKDHGVEVVINCIHGAPGEDGSIAGLMELANIPYVAPGVTAAALAMDKIATKLVLTASGIPVTKYEWFTADDWQENQADVEARLNRLEGPWFVKPATLGSSVGVTRASTPAELESAIELAAQFDSRIIVEEEARDCIEINISVYGPAAASHVSTTEQPIKSDDFLTYADKYERGGKKSGGMASLDRRIPAPIASDFAKKLQQTAQDIWKIFNSHGLARIDFLANPTTEEFYVTEVNCPPGSMAFYLWEATGVTYTDLIENLVTYALERQQQKEKLVSSIPSNILQKK